MNAIVLALVTTHRVHNGHYHYEESYKRYYDPSLLGCGGYHHGYIMACVHESHVDIYPRIELDLGSNGGILLA